MLTTSSTHENTTLSQRPSRLSSFVSQTALHRLFQVPFRFLEGPEQQQPSTTDATPDRQLGPMYDMPPVGGDHAFIEPQEWHASVILIEHNVFSTSRPYPVPKQPRHIPDACLCYGHCVADTHMRSACINVAASTVCDDLNCSLRSDCGNRFEQRYHLDLIETRVGLGVACSFRIPREAFVVEYVGEVLYDADAATREDQQYQAELRTRAGWSGGAALVIDAVSCGNKSRFINHSCVPNCAMYECDWTNTTRLGIFANEDIPALRELTFQYTTRKQQEFECQCAVHYS